MKLYRFITGPDDEAFCMRVTESLNNGWELRGRASLTLDGKRRLQDRSSSKRSRAKSFREI